MKTKTNKITRSTAIAHKGQTTADTKKKFEVTLFFSTHNMGSVIIAATSLAEARKWADGFCPKNGGLWATTVELVRQEAAND